MKKFVVLKFVSMASIVAVISMFFLAGCAEDPANSSNNGGDGISSSGGTTAAVRNITLKNSTSYTINGIWMKPSTSHDWGNNLWGYSYLNDEQSKTLDFSPALSAGVTYDIRLQTSTGNYIFIKYRIKISTGLNITFTVNDLTDESDYPSITVQNRTGADFNGFYIKPSVSEDWGKSFSNISNNNNGTAKIFIPPSSYTKFDIQMKSSDPTNTYTMRNVTITDGMVLMFTREDADSPITGSPIIVIENNTGYTINGIWIRKPTSHDWGNNLWGYSYLNDNQSRTFILSQSLSANNIYDIRLQTSSSDYTYIKYRLSIVSDGMVVTFNATDLNDESDYPSITIQNRTGATLNGFYVKPSVSEDWGKSFNNISNNNNGTAKILIPPSSYTEFDIQVTSTNPTATYTMRNVTIADGMVFMFTRANADNSIAGSQVIVIENNTGYTINGIWIKSSITDDWGSNLWGYSYLNDNQSRTFELSQSVGSVDIRLSTNSSTTGGSQFIKRSLLVSDGMVVTFAGSDFTE